MERVKISLADWSSKVLLQTQRGDDGEFACSFGLVVVALSSKPASEVPQRGGWYEWSCADLPASRMAIAIRISMRPCIRSAARSRHAEHCAGGAAAQVAAAPAAMWMARDAPLASSSVTKPTIPA